MTIKQRFGEKCLFRFIVNSDIIFYEGVDIFEHIHHIIDEIIDDLKLTKNEFYKLYVDITRHVGFEFPVLNTQPANFKIKFIKL